MFLLGCGVYSGFAVSRLLLLWFGWVYRVSWVCGFWMWFCGVIYGWFWWISVWCRFWRC